ncbi:MAG: hypothetical protein ACI9OJ_004598 [Myxococcota bacterium]|jgi:uncharacterized protein YbjT (DUF2867 family)
MNNTSRMPTIAIAGASGFVGRALLQALDGYERIGLSRRARQDEPGLAWREADLFSLLQVEAGLAGADIAIYLVHSMAPSARLTQGRFDDMDLLLADNFARAAERAGVEHIIYVGGVVPHEGGRLSAHLESRLEVERALTTRGANVTALRAGLIVGPGGSSVDLLCTLVKRLPVMVLPRWTASMTEPIALDDVVRAVRIVVESPDAFIGAFDLKGPVVLSYRDLMIRTARLIGRKPRTVDVPLLSPRFSALWVSTFSGAPMALVKPLVASLEHDMVARDNRLSDRLRAGLTPLDSALSEAIEALLPGSSRSSSGPSDAVARSVQRLPRPEGWSAKDIADEYLRWLPDFSPLLRLGYSPERSADDRPLFYVEGGWLAGATPPDATRGRLEFRVVGEPPCVIAAVHDFRPSLPWLVYRLTQAKAHAVVMWLFGRRLRSRQPRPA